MRRERTEEECLRRVRRAARARRPRKLLLAALWVVLVLVGFAGIYFGSKPMKYVGAMANLVGTFGMLGMPWWRDRSLAAAIAALRSTGALPDVITLLDHDCGRQTREAATRKIAELLPLVRPDALRLDADSLALLRAHLAWSPRRLRADFCVAVLDYLAAIGDTTALEMAEDLADQDLKPDPLAAAQRCRDRLLAVQADAARSGSLLRPAEAPGETLLRPVDPAPEEQLLRAVGGEAE